MTEFTPPGDTSPIHPRTGTRDLSIVDLAVVAAQEEAAFRDASPISGMAARIYDEPALQQHALRLTKGDPELADELLQRLAVVSLSPTDRCRPASMWDGAGWY